MFPGDFVSQFVSALPVSTGDLELDALFEVKKCSMMAIDEMFAKELATFRRCFWQRYNRRKCAHIQRELATTADLPSHSALFYLQLLDLAHKWSEKEESQ